MLSARLGGILGREDIVYLATSARAAQGVERQYRDAFRRSIFAAAERALVDLAEGTFDPDSFDFQPLITRHAIASSEAGTKRPAPVTAKLGRGDALRKVFAQWDRWRKGELPKRQRKNAKAIRDVFLHAVQDFWSKRSGEFRRGDIFDQQAARAAFVRSAKIPIARAEMIVATETTHYYNKTRVEIYDQAEGVTHYLFVAIRDRRTTKWCCDFRRGGRDGLVYVKGSALAQRECPACHWNCRSEFLPLSPSNPRHLRLIQDAQRGRENNSPTPLPPGWNGR